MSDRSDRFFTWVWRLDGLLLLGLAAAAAAAGLALLVNLAIFSSRERPERQLTQVAGADLGAQDLRLADFEAVGDTHWLYAALAAPSEYVGSSSSGGLGAVHNLLFFDTESKKAHWLLPGNERIVATHSFLWDPPGSRYGYEPWEGQNRQRVALGLLLELQEPREGGAPASRSLAAATPDGRSLTPLVDSIEGLLGFHQPNPSSVLVFYVSGGSARVLDLDPASRTIRSDEVLATEE